MWRRFTAESDEAQGVPQAERRFGPAGGHVLVPAPLAEQSEFPTSFMPSPSRPSLTGLSHRFKPPVSELTPENRLARRLGAVGVVCSLIPSVIAAVPVVGADAQRPESLVLAVIFSAALSGTFLMGLGGLAWVTAKLIQPRSSQIVRVQTAAGVVTSAVVFVYMLVRGAGEAFRLSSGETLGLGSCEFIVEGLAQLAVPLLVEYGMWTAVLGSTAVVTAVLAGYLVARPIRQMPSIWKVAGRSALSLVAFAGLLLVLSSPRDLRSEPLSATADLSVLASWAQRRENDEKLSAGDETLIAAVRPGPSRQVEAVFDASLRHHAASEHPKVQPNVLIIMLESVGVHHLGFMGYGRNTTPNLDALARDSVRYLLARTTATHSNYAQMAVLSSLFPRRYSGLDTYRRLDYPRVLWHDLLLKLGYRTATYSSQDERWQGMIRFQSTSADHVLEHAGNYAGPKQLMGSESTVPDEVTTRRAVRWIESQPGAFGLYVNFQSTHFPYVVPKHVNGKFHPDQPTKGKFHYLNYPKEDRSVAINRYDNALLYVDRQIGELLKSLRDTQRLDSTIVVVTSDHGEMFGDHGMVTHGRSLFEEEARVPLLIRYPQRLTPRDVEQPVSTLDILPTLSGLLDIPAHPAFQGVDLLSHEPNRHRPVFLNIQGMRSRDGVVCDGYKYVRGPHGNKPALFDLETDPFETNNLVESDQLRAGVLDRFLAAHMRAQLAYHRPGDSSLRDARFAPRFGDCPQLAPVESDGEVAEPVQDEVRASKLGRL